MTQEEKRQAIELLRTMVREQHGQLEKIEPRLAEYYDHLCEHTSAEPGDENDLHGGYELLGGIRLLRMLERYEFNYEAVRDDIYDGEGEWRKDKEGYWVHVRDGLRQPGREKPVVYRFEPFQVFCIVCMHGPMAWVPTGSLEGERRLLETERVNVLSGEIEDLRRVCTRFILFGPRKINKSGFAAMEIVRDFLHGDHDAQCVCTANSQEQSKILFGKAKDMLLQLDPVSGRKFTGKYLSYSATEVKFQKGSFRAAELQAIPAGGKMPDGKFCSFLAEDEYGSAEFVNKRSDMGNTAAVMKSSMGPRREPMELITTTAAVIKAGPFMQILDATHRLLLQELKYATGEATPTLSEDSQLCLLLEPDEWERDEDYLLSSRPLRRKVNPMLGKIVQHSFYEKAVTESRQDDTTKRETIAKLFNIYQGVSVEEWIKADAVRPLQVERRIDECTADKGWVVFTGLDFSQGDDLHTASYLAARKHPSGKGTEFFADTDVWVKESTAASSAISPLYEQWHADGWLGYSPGKIFEPSLYIVRLDELLKKGVQFMFWGYDKYKSKDPINSLKAFLQSKMKVANPDPYIQVVSQLNSEFDGPTDDLYKAMFAPVPFIRFSMSPLWPFCFGNAVLEIDGRGNKRPVKRAQTDSCKIDPVQALIMAMDLYERFEGSRR